MATPSTSLPLFLAVLMVSAPALAQHALPDPTKTPGALNPDVTQATIGQTICVHGWTKTVRPSSSYTTRLKLKQIRDFGYQDADLGHFEEDHLVPLVLGGAPYNALNLWPEPMTNAPGGWSAAVKDELEVTLARLVCSKRIPLAEAQQAIATNWIAAFNRYVTGNGE